MCISAREVNQSAGPVALCQLMHRAETITAHWITHVYENVPKVFKSEQVSYPQADLD